MSTGSSASTSEVKSASDLGGLLYYFFMPPGRGALPHGRQQAVANVLSVVLVAVKFMLQRLVLERGTDD